MGKYIVDFVCHEIKLIIEIDGSQHFDNLEYDRKRTDWLNQKGYRVIRFWSNEIFLNMEGVKEVIWDVCMQYKM